MGIIGYIRMRYEMHMKEVRDRNAREDYLLQEGRKFGRDMYIAVHHTQERLRMIESLLRNNKTPEEINYLYGWNLKDIQIIQERMYDEDNRLDEWMLLYMAFSMEDIERIHTTNPTVRMTIEEMKKIRGCERYVQFESGNQRRWYCDR